MSLSGDSDDDDDDLLLLSSKPIFTKSKNKKTTRKEKASFSYLDNMVKKSSKRMEQLARIQGMKDKEEEDEENDEEHEDDADNKGKGNKKMKIHIEKPQIKSAARSNIHNNAKEEANAKPAKKFKLNGLDNEEFWSKLKSRSENAQTNMKEDDRRRQNLRDAIDGLDILRHTNSTDSLVSGSSKHLNNNANDDHLGMENNEDDDEQQRDQRMALLGLVTGKSSNVGTRSLFGFQRIKRSTDTKDDYNHKHSSLAKSQSSLSMFLSYNESMEELKSIIISMEKSPPRSLSKSIQNHWHQSKQQFLIPIEKALKFDLLPQLLETRTNWASIHDSSSTDKGGKKRRRQNDSKDLSKTTSPNTIIIPSRLLTWVIRTSFSGRNMGTELSHGAHEMFLKLFQQTSNEIIILNTNNSSTTGAANDDDTFNHIFHIRDFVIILESEFGLWTKEGPTLAPTPQSVESNEDSNFNIVQSNDFSNEIGLKHFMELWSLALDKDLVTWDGESADSFAKQSWNDEDMSCLCAMTARFVAIILRCGLDQSFRSGNRLLKAQITLLHSSFDWIQRRYQSTIIESAISNDDRSKVPKEFLKWIEYTADLSLKLCSNISGDALSSKDVKGWLTLVLGVRTCQFINQKDYVAVTFFAIFSCLAVRSCMGAAVNDWDTKVQRHVTAFHKDVKKNGGDTNVSSLPSPSIELRFKCIVTIEIVLNAIIKAGDSITSDGPRFLAGVDMAAHCDQMGLALFKLNIQNLNVEGLGGIYEDKAVAGAMADHFERLENLCNELKKKVFSILVDKNMMRVKELLSLMSGFYRDRKTKANASAKRRESIVAKQSKLSMDLFLKKEENSSDNEGTSPNNVFIT
mmetsp:Transcript_15564/g.18089  ORF Transcript_15564/g.18089 Transcript_15564/m.18089 type:complete len:855 (+) Transcript_15564:78-2642(+)